MPAEANAAPAANRSLGERKLSTASMGSIVFVEHEQQEGASSGAAVRLDRQSSQALASSADNAQQGVPFRSPELVTSYRRIRLVRSWEGCSSLSLPSVAHAEGSPARPCRSVFRRWALML